MRKLVVVAVVAAVSCAQRTEMPSDLAEKIARLHSNDAVERGTAAYALRGMGPRALPAAPDLIALLSDDTQLVREPEGQRTSVSAEADAALTAIGDESIDPALFIDALKRLGWNGRDNVSQHVKYSGDPRVIPALVDALLEPGEDLPDVGMPDISSAALLERSLGPPRHPVEHARRTIANDLELAAQRARERGGVIAAEPIRRLIEALESPTPAIRKYAIVALGGIGDATATDPLLAIARNPSTDHELRIIATFSLSGLHDPRVVPALIAMLNDANPDSRGAAMRALRDCRDRRAVPVLILALNDRHNRRDATAALASIGDPTALPPLLALLNDPEPGMREGIAEALSSLRDERAIDPLIAALEREKLDYVRDSIKRALERITHAKRADAAAWKAWRERKWWQFWK